MLSWPSLQSTPTAYRPTSRRPRRVRPSLIGHGYHDNSILDSTEAAPEDASMGARIVGMLGVVGVLVAGELGFAAEGDKAAPTSGAAPVSVPAPASGPAPAGVAAPPTVPGNRAGDYVGQQVTIEGRVTAVHES